tara:strand:- start:319 stop:531 length:213 start_codon:yes stop_codon:yes gene_type:complete
MKYLLTITLCSMMDNTCVAPYTFPQIYDDLYTCQISGYKKAIEKIEEIGNDKVNKIGIFSTFACRKIDTI